MNFLKITLSAVAVFLISISVPTLRTPAAAAENEPLDVHLTIETKEIDISEIPDDRIVCLEITVENAPPFVGLTMYLDKDSRLQFTDRKPFKPADGVDNIGSINSITHKDEPDIMGCAVPTKNLLKEDHNGVLVIARLILPENVQAGDFYYLNFTPYLRNNSMSIDLSIYREDSYGLESFTELNNGGIRITEKAPPPPPKPPASTASSSASSTTSATPVSTASSSTAASSSTTSATPVSTASSSTATSSSTTSSTPASTASSSTAAASSTTSSTPASTASSSTAAASSTTSSAPVSTASVSTAASSSTTSSAPVSTASVSTAAASYSSSTSSSVPETTADNSKEEQESKNKSPITAVLIALGVLALILTAVFLVRAKRKK